MLAAPKSGTSPHTSGTLSDKLAEYNALLRGVLRDLLAHRPGLEPFYGMMAYHLGWLDTDFRQQDARAGKSLRPSMCFLVGEGLGVKPERLASIAAGIELLHNFSLIHDDIQDHSSTRRNRPTVWTIWGAPQAINAGDGMFSLAHVAWLGSSIAEDDPVAFAAIVRSLEAAILRLCEGQFLDMQGEGHLDTTSEAYLQMIGRKTAALIGESAWVAARAAGAAETALGSARAFGFELGLAFQIRDDLLGIWGEEQETGKSASTDIATRKMTLPIIEALEAGSPAVREALRACYSSAPSAENEQQIRELLEATGVRQLTLDQETRHWTAAMLALESLPLDDEWQERLREFARSFVGRRA